MPVLSEIPSPVRLILSLSRLLNLCSRKQRGCNAIAFAAAFDDKLVCAAAADAGVHVVQALTVFSDNVPVQKARSRLCCAVMGSVGGAAAFRSGCLASCRQLSFSPPPARSFSTQQLLCRIPPDAFASPSPQAAASALAAIFAASGSGGPPVRDAVELLLDGGAVEHLVHLTNSPSISLQLAGMLAIDMLATRAKPKDLLRFAADHGAQRGRRRPEHKAAEVR